MKRPQTARTKRGLRQVVVLTVVGLFMAISPALTENTDPNNNDSQYAWVENVGWINAEPSGDGGPGVRVGDDEVSGWMWGENIGWVSLSCKNTLTCAAVEYGVANDGAGGLSGYAWAENLGWLSFACENTASCGTADYGVEIDPATGDFSGYAWAENAGWVSFNCTNTASCGDADYKMRTGWICDPPPTAPTGSSSLSLGKSVADALLSWGLVSNATGSDIVRGDLVCLLSTNGDFAACTGMCLDDNRTASSMLDPDTPSVGQGFWYLVRGQNCGGNGTYDSGGPSQVGLRDMEIDGSGNDCP